MLGDRAISLRRQYHDMRDWRCFDVRRVFPGLQTLADFHASTVCDNNFLSGRVLLAIDLMSFRRDIGSIVAGTSEIVDVAACEDPKLSWIEDP